MARTTGDPRTDGAAAGGRPEGGATPPEPLARPEWLADMPYFALSALFHLALLALLYGLVVETRARIPEETAIRIRPIPPPPPKYDPSLPRRTERTRAPLPRHDSRLPDIPPKEDPIRPDIRPGLRTEGVGVLDPGARLADIGAGRIPELYADRIGAGLPGGAAPAAAEDAVRAALEWLRRHQAPNGSWESADFVKRCRKTCQNENPARYGDGRGFPAHDVGVTGLAILAFAGYGHTHRDGVFPEYVECLRKAVDYLLSVQVKSNDPTTNGRFGDEEDEQWIYDHAIATMGMAELLVMSNDVIKLKRPVTDAGRVYSTAIGAMTLEVYYRFSRIP